MNKITGTLLAGSLLALAGAFGPAHAVAIDVPAPPKPDFEIQEQLTKGSFADGGSGQFIVTNNSEIYFIVGFGVGNPAPATATTQRPGWRAFISQECIDGEACFAYTTTNIDDGTVEAGNWLGQGTEDLFFWSSAFLASPVILIAISTDGNIVSCTTDTTVTDNPNLKVGSCSIEVPEPGTVSLLGLSLLGLGLAVRRRYA